MKPFQLSPQKLAVALCVGFASLSSTAQIVNGGFESGLVGWTRYGDVSTQSNAPAGSAKLLLTTAGLDPDEFNAAGALVGPFNVSGTGATEAGVPAGLEALSGYAVGAFDAYGRFAIEGSLARQTFNAQAGDTLSFVWNFGTRETDLDHAFVVIDGVVTSLSGSSLPSRLGSGDDLFQTGFQSFSSSFTASGLHTVAFGVVDLKDASLRSSLAIDQVQISAVPEPGSAVLSLIGLAVLGLWASGRKKERTSQRLLAVV